jgi:hypothetical protein
VLPKPVTDDELRAAVRFAVARHDAIDAEAPRRLHLFDTQMSSAD